MLAKGDLRQHSLQAYPASWRPQHSLSSCVMWPILLDRLPCESSVQMLQKLDDYYTQDVRIDLVAASRLADINPKHPEYRAAAARGAFVVTVLQGDVYESVYAPLLERAFDTLAEAQLFYDNLSSEHPDAKCFDFVAHPTGTATAQTTGRD